MTLSIMTHSINDTQIMTLCIKDLYRTLSINDTQHKGLYRTLSIKYTSIIALSIKAGIGRSA